MMVVTHEMGFASKAAYRVIFMDKGEIVEDDALKTDFFGLASQRSRAKVPVEVEPVIPGRLEEANPESRDSPMCNRTSEVHASRAPE